MIHRTSSRRRVTRICGGCALWTEDRRATDGRLNMKGKCHLRLGYDPRHRFGPACRNHTSITLAERVGIVSRRDHEVRT